MVLMLMKNSDNTNADKTAEFNKFLHDTVSCVQLYHPISNYVIPCWKVYLAYILNS